MTLVWLRCRGRTFAVPGAHAMQNREEFTVRTFGRRCDLLVVEGYRKPQQNASSSIHGNKSLF